MFSENRDFENMENIKNGVPFIKQVFNVFYVFQNKNLFLKIGTINCTTLSTYCLIIRLYKYQHTISIHFTNV